MIYIQSIVVVVIEISIDLEYFFELVNKYTNYVIRKIARSLELYL